MLASHLSICSDAIRSISEPSLLILQSYYNFPDVSQVCVKIITGFESKNDGYLKVEMNGDINVYDKFGKRDVVIDTCIKGLKSLTLNNPKINAWAGQIKIKVDGKFVPIDCRGCTGSPSLKDGFIVVDGNSDSEKMANTHCLDGDVCSLVWNIKGI